jgi:hypothetical protein
MLTPAFSKEAERKKKEVIRPLNAYVTYRVARTIQVN